MGDTTNAIESVNLSLRKPSKNRASFLSDEAAIKLLYLGLRNIAQRWTMPIQNWKLAWGLPLNLWMTPVKRKRSISD